MDDATAVPSRFRAGWHPTNVGHLVMGVAFLGIVGIWALVVSETVTGEDIRWLLPIPWVVAGLAGLLVIAFSGRRRPAPQPAAVTTRAEEPQTEPETDDDDDNTRIIDTEENS
ncbi:hypothetical protein [Nocardioides speluncae]|uniref:hypothetical protein n=1 Tax=Nocardioides speluncae TaxID=2670337 RepID=UPI0012B1755A|nr:hypothetical protein [Nocardioides speluncae]